MFPSPYGVSFILINILKQALDNIDNKGFRLLTEYHSFLSKEKVAQELSLGCFRLLTEYHSFLYKLVSFNRLQ